MTTTTITLNETDEKILEEIDTHGRASPALLSDILDKNTQYVRDRIKRLDEHGVLQKVAHGLYDRPETAAQYLPDDE